MIALGLMAIYLLLFLGVGFAVKNWKYRIIGWAILLVIPIMLKLCDNHPDEEEAKPKQLFTVEQDPAKIRNNLAGICNKEQRILSRQELYQRAIVDEMRKMLEDKRKIQEKDKKNGFTSGAYYEVLMSIGTMTIDEFIQKVKNMKKGPGISYKKQLGLEPVQTIERFTQRLKETGNKLIVVVYTGSPECVYIIDYGDCLSILSEKETKRDGALFPDQDPSRRRYEPESAKKSGYGLFYLRSSNNHINFNTGEYTYTVRRPVYTPVSNCGEIIYGFCLTQPIIGTPIKH